jgi:hypothetical protein
VCRARACVCECRQGDNKGARTCILHAMSMKYIRTNASAMLQAAVTEHSQRAAPCPRTHLLPSVSSPWLRSIMNVFFGPRLAWEWVVKR